MSSITCDRSTSTAFNSWSGRARHEINAERGSLQVMGMIEEPISARWVDAIGGAE